MMYEIMELLDRQLEKANVKFVNKTIEEKEKGEEDDSRISSGESDAD